MYTKLLNYYLNVSVLITSDDITFVHYQYYNVEMNLKRF